MTDEFGEFISGGYDRYDLVRPEKRPDSFSALLPEMLMSVSPCIAEVGPRCLWESDWGRLSLEAVELSDASIDAIVERTALPERVDTASEPAHVMPFGFSSFAIASAFHEQMTAPTLLVGIGLHSSLLPSLEAQRSQDVNNGYGLMERIEQRQTLRQGEILGFEPLGFYAMSFHSWLCGYFPEKVNKELQIRPVGNGFIADFAEAIEVTDYVRKADGEPAIWLPSAAMAGREI